MYACNNEDFWPESLLGRTSDREVVLSRYLRSKLIELIELIELNLVQ